MCLFTDPAAQLVVAGPEETLGAIARALAHFGEPALRYAAQRNVRIVPLESTQRYCEASAAYDRPAGRTQIWTTNRTQIRGHGMALSP